MNKITIFCHRHNGIFCKRKRIRNWSDLRMLHHHSHHFYFGTGIYVSHHSPCSNPNPVLLSIDHRSSFHPVYAFLPFSLWEAHQADKCSLQTRDQYVLCPTKIICLLSCLALSVKRPFVRLQLLLLLLLFLRLLLIIYICSAQVMQRGIQNRSPVNRRQSHAIGSLSLQRLLPIQSALCKAEFQIWLTGDWWGHPEWCNAANRRTGAM